MNENNDDKLFSFNVDDFIDTNIVEYTDLTDVDRALAAFWARLLNRMTVTDTNRLENREFVTFMRKPLNEMIYCGQFDDPTSFVQHLLSKTKETDREYTLPTCFLSRDPSIAYCDGTDYFDLVDMGALVDGAGNRTAQVDKSYLKLNYTLTTLCWNKSTAARLGLGISMYLRRNKRGRERTFKAKTMLAGVPVVIHIEINQPALIIGQPISTSYDNNRIVGNSFQLEVIAEVLEARSINPIVDHYDVIHPTGEMA